MKGRKRVVRPDYLHSRRTKRGYEMWWYRPSWGWFCTYGLMTMLSVGGWEASTPWPQALISPQLWWVQALSLAGLIVGVWGLLGSLFNRHRVIVNKYQLIHVTRPVRLFDRSLAFDLSLIHRFYLDKRRGFVWSDYRVLALLSGRRAEVLFATEDNLVAFWIMQALCGVMRRERGGDNSFVDHIRKSKSSEGKKSGQGVSI